MRFSIGGKQREVSTGETAKAAAAEAAARIYSTRVQARPGRKVATSPLADLLEAWLAERAAEKSAAYVVTLREYAGYWRQLWQDLAAITEETIAQYISERLSDGVLPQTVRKELSALNTFLRWLKRRGYLPRMPQFDRPEGSGGDYEATCLTVDQAEAVLTELKGNRRVWAYYEFVWQTGLRKGHVSRIEWRDVDLAAAELQLRAVTDKRGFARVIPLSPRAVRALRSLGAAVGLIFGLRDYRSSLRDAATRAKLPAELVASLHDRAWRHSAATRIASRTDNLPALMYILGHKHLQTTARYLHPQLSQARALVEADSRAELGQKRGKRGGRKR